MNGLNNSYAGIVEELVNLDDEGQEACILVGVVATADAGAAIADADAGAATADLNLVRRSSLYFWHSYWHSYCQLWYQPCYWRYPH